MVEMPFALFSFFFYRLIRLEITSSCSMNNSLKFKIILCANEFTFPQMLNIVAEKLFFLRDASFMLDGLAFYDKLPDGVIYFIWVLLQAFFSVLSSLKRASWFCFVFLCGDQKSRELGHCLA